MALNHLNLLRPLVCRSLLRQVKPLPVASNRARLPLLYPDTACLPAACSRLYASKKPKGKAKGQSAKVNINSTLVEDIISLDEVKADMTAVLDSLKDDFTRNLSIRTSAGALDHIVVTTQDGKFPLRQLGQISMKSPQIIMVNMGSFPEATAAATHALRESSMNLNPEVDGTIIKVPVPKPLSPTPSLSFPSAKSNKLTRDCPSLTHQSAACVYTVCFYLTYTHMCVVTREHRENLSKLAKQLGNKAKDSLRRVRSNAVTQVKKAKEGHSEDVIRLVEKQIQQLSDNMAVEIDKQLTAKTKELLG